MPLASSLFLLCNELLCRILQYTTVIDLILCLLVWMCLYYIPIRWNIIAQLNHSYNCPMMEFYKFFEFIWPPKSHNYIGILIYAYVLDCIYVNSYHYRFWLYHIYSYYPTLVQSVYYNLDFTCGITIPFKKY